MRIHTTISDAFAFLALGSLAMGGLTAMITFASAMDTQVEPIRAIAGCLGVICFIIIGAIAGLLSHMLSDWEDNSQG